MMNQIQLQYLINEMDGADTIYNEADGTYTSEGAPSWNAYRKAEALTDTNCISYLIDMFKTSNKESVKRNIYFALGCLGANTGDKRVVDFLLKQLDKETNKHTLERILMSIEEQEVIPDAASIIKCLDDERWLVRHSAISALGKFKSTDVVEDALIEVIRKSQDEYDLYYALGSLSNMGSAKSIPYILPLLTNTKGEVRRSAVCALASLGGAAYLSHYIEALGDRSPHVKSYALLAIKNHGDETAIDVVYKRVKTVLSKKRKIDSDELVPAFEFLSKYKDYDNKVQKLLEWIKIKKWDFLSDREKEGFRKSTN
ncbi:HEAT repeat domain-containing protein [Niallia circulans]|uniref:HEAT repeat domain-containing protein n=1 Tax=Niallia circulans TaxID=1397 RepID=A0A553STA9_NIACI|nr:HEAT repeat domain-containing protein [Niallia circulans]TRZ40222.1 HEAT repeat domain-containing protein [Niallia circulans]